MTNEEFETMYTGDLYYSVIIIPDYFYYYFICFIIINTTVIIILLFLSLILISYQLCLFLSVLFISVLSIIMRYLYIISRFGSEFQIVKRRSQDYLIRSVGRVGKERRSCRRPTSSNQS